MKRVRTPTVLQMEAAECGAACLAMVLAHHGRWEPLESLRVACGVSRDGSKASNVVKAARRLGMNAKGFRKEPDGLLELPRPSIIHWNFNHFVVFEGLRGEHAWINDPALGRRKVTRQELNEAFTGVVLALEPGDAFERGGRRSSLFPELWRHLRHSRDGIAYVALASVFLVVPGLLVPMLAKVFVDDLLIAGMHDWLAPLLIGLGLTALLRGVTSALQLRYLLRLETKLSTMMANRYFHHLLSLPSSFFTQRHPGDLAGRVASSDRIAGLISGQLATSLLELVAVVFYGVVMIAFDLLLGLVGLGLAAINVIILRSVAARRDDLNRALLNEQAKMQSATVGSIAAMETLKAGGLEQEAFARWAGYQATTLQTQQALGEVSSFLSITPRLLSGVSSAAVLGLGGLHVIQGTLSIGELVAVQTLLASISQPVEKLVGLGDKLQLAKGDLARLADAFHQDVVDAADTETRVTSMPRGELQLRGVSFGYNPLDPPLIIDFDLTLKCGARVALVGGSGSGKSTIGRLACGLQSPWSGEVLMDGRPLADIPSERFAMAISHVDQEVMLFAGSVRDNLTLWDPSVSEAALTQALKDAEIHAEIVSRPSQYDAVVAEAGANFSGGQRQRLEIARALVNDPALLVLDEATSALDPVTEKRIDDNLRRRGCTCLIIAHRLSTIRDCDEIIVLDRGQVVERGTHQRLMESDGQYAALLGATA
jgi:NHLM bacteriocin system ABC transporter peptidase/ATP-binding protein